MVNSTRQSDEWNQIKFWAWVDLNEMSLRLIEVIIEEY